MNATSCGLCYMQHRQSAHVRMYKTPSSKCRLVLTVLQRLALYRYCWRLWHTRGDTYHGTPKLSYSIVQYIVESSSDKQLSDEQQTRDHQGPIPSIRYSMAHPCQWHNNNGALRRRRQREKWNWELDRDNTLHSRQPGVYATYH